MFCCIKCFRDPYIQSFIQTNGQTEDCSYCGEQNTQCITPEKLRATVSPVFYMYRPTAEFIFPSDIENKNIGNKIWEQMQQDWLIFSESLSEEDHKKLLEDIIDDDGSILWDQDVYIQEKFLGLYNENTYTWEKFKAEIKTKNRFFPDEKVSPERLEFLLSSIETKTKKGEHFYRGRITEEKSRLTPKKMGMPPAKKAKNGRANPVGIPYLYVAEDPYTAVAELKGNIKDHVTIGHFRTKEELRVVDLSQISPFQLTLHNDFDSIVQDIDFLNGLGNDLSSPINPRAADVEYLPTQYLCEFIKKCGWDGVMYRSHFGSGNNLAFFSENKLKCISTKTKEISQVSWELV